MSNHSLPFSIMALLTGFILTSPASGAQDIGTQKAQTCIGCHGPEGNSSSGQYPILAGQQPAYLKNQLLAFKNGTRKNPMMNGLAAGLSNDDINQLARYFSGQRIKSAGGDPAAAKAGHTQFGMCMGCHGAKGQGNGQFPRLAGQQPDYIVKQLKHFKDGTRKNGAMQAIAANLNEENMKALAAYLGSLE